MTATISGPTLQYYLGNYFEEVGLRAMLCTSGYAFDKDLDTLASAAIYEVSGAGYIAGGVGLTGVAVTIDTTAHEVRLVSEDAEFGAINVTNAAQIVVYTVGTTAAPSRIVSVHTFTATDIAQLFSFAWPPDGSGKGVIGVFPY